MEKISSPAELRIIIQKTIMSDGQHLSPKVQEAISVAMSEPSPIAGIVKTMEGVYADRETAPAVWLTVGAQCASIVEEYAFFGKGERASKLLQIFRRHLGERKTPDPAADPDVDLEFQDEDVAEDDQTEEGAAPPT